jgi:SAM-dependent methyltransferase
MPEQSEHLTGDGFGSRQPTSHERMTGLPWDASYHHGSPPWDIGRPQPVVERLAAEGGLSGSVLDAGCGTGENTLHIAALGSSVLGVDIAETAIAQARAKARDRGIAAEFAVADALELGRLARTFETVLDCALCHTFDVAERPEYAASIASATAPGGTLYVLCFSDEGEDIGPHPLSRDELEAAFDRGIGWVVAAVERSRLVTRYHREGAAAWFATIHRL